MTTRFPRLDRMIGLILLGGKGQQIIPAGDRLIIELPDGGYGPPEARAPEAVAHDVKHGLVSEESARQDYPQHKRE